MLFGLAQVVSSLAARVFTEPWSIVSGVSFMLLAVIAWRNTCAFTRIARDEVAISNGFRIRHIPASEIASIQCGTAHHPILLHLTSGKSVPLAFIPQSALKDVQNLTQR